VNASEPADPDQSVEADGSEPPHRLKPSSNLILALVRSGISSGYALRRAIEDMRFEAFWSTSLAQIYPELAQLERDGYLTGRDDPHGARARRAHELTAKGEETLMAWLRERDFPSMAVHDEGLLRLGFADMLEPGDALALVREMRERAQRGAAEFREHNVPMAAAMEPAGYRFPLVVARMGAEYHEWAAAFLAKIEAELERGAG
jgi:PadR family transcriptional regulator, regulatory protein AphA